MQINDKPFSIYDFLGYLIPGIFAFYASIFIYNYIIKHQIKVILRDAGKLKKNILKAPFQEVLYAV